MHREARRRARVQERIGIGWNTIVLSTLIRLIVMLIGAAECRGLTGMKWSLLEPISRRWEPQFRETSTLRTPYLSDVRPQGRHPRASQASLQGWPNCQDPPGLAGMIGYRSLRGHLISVRKRDSECQQAGNGGRGRMERILHGVGWALAARR